MLVRNWTCLRKFAVLFILACSAAHGKSELQPAGLAVYTETARDIYIAGLLMPPDASLDNVFLAPGPKGMEYRIATRRISSRGFSGTLLLQAEFGSGERAPDEVIDTLNTLKKKIKGSLLRGDSFVIYLSEDEKTTFYLNDTKLLTVNDGAVFDFFFSGWVGDSSSALIREKLLSGNLEADTLSRFERLSPTDERLATIEEWMAPPPPPKPKPKPKPEPKPVEPAAPAVQVADAGAAGTPAAGSPAAAPAAEGTETVAAAEGTPAATDTPQVPGPAPATTVAAAVTAPAAGLAAASAVPVEAEAGDIAKADSTAEELEALEALDDREYQRQLQDYVTHIMRAVFGKVKYPKRAIKREREGKVELLAYMDTDGKLMELTLDHSSGYTSLDEAAEKAVRKAAPFPELTQAAKEEFLSDDGSGYVMTIPITFRLQK